MCLNCKDERTLIIDWSMLKNNLKIASKFIKVFPSGQSRTREACTALTESLYPISRRQLEVYFKKYSDKVELARVWKTHILCLYIFDNSMSNDNYYYYYYHNNCNDNNDDSNEFNLSMTWNFLWLHLLLPLLYMTIIIIFIMCIYIPSLMLAYLCIIYLLYDIYRH